MLRRVIVAAMFLAVFGVAGWVVPQKTEAWYGYYPYDYGYPRRGYDYPGAPYYPGYGPPYYPGYGPPYAAGPGQQYPVNHIPPRYMYYPRDFYYGPGYGY
jgi:hypothetical protein